MKVEIENLSPIERKLSVEIPWDKVKEELDLAYKGLSKKARLKGFRAGKVPRKVLEQFYKSTVESEVLNRLVDDSFRQAVEEEDLVPIAAPKLEDMPELAEEEPLKYVATVEVKPEINVDGYQGIEVIKKVRQVEDTEIEVELNQLREKAVVIEQVTDRKDVQMGDLAVVDFFGYINGETFKGGKGINYTVEVGSKQMITGFEEELVGMEVGGEQKVFELRFPKDEGPEEARGKMVEWKVDLKEIKTKILPELDDEFAMDLGECDTLDELKEKIRENLSTREDAKGRRQLRDQVMEKLVDVNTVDVPKMMVDRQLDFMLQDATKVAENSTDPKIHEAIAKLKDEARPRAETQVAGMLLLEAVARKEKIEVSDTDLDGRLQDLAREHRMALGQLKQQLKQGDQLEGIRYNMLQDKALDWVLDNATVVEQTVTTEELAQEEEEARKKAEELLGDSEAEEEGE